MSTLNEVEGRINAHVDVCEIRYKGIEREMQGVNARLKRIEQLMIGACTALIGLLIHLLTKV